MLKEEAGKLENLIDDLKISINRLEQIPYTLAKVVEVEKYITRAIKIEEEDLLGLTELYRTELIALAFGED